MASHQILLYLSKTPPVILVVAIMSGLFIYKKLDSFHKALLLYLCLMLCTDAAARLLGYYLGNNHIMLSIYSLAEVVFFIVLYKKYLLKLPHKITTALGGACFAFIFIEFLYYFVLNDFNAKQYQPYSKVACNFIIILLSLNLLSEKLGSSKQIKWNYYAFAMVTLFVFTINTLIFLPFNFLVHETSGIKFYFWSVNIIINGLFYIYLTGMLWKNGRTRG